MQRGNLPANTGPPFRGASAKLPQTFREIRRLFWYSWLAVGNCSSSKRCVSCTQQHLFFYWNRFSELFHARTETFHFIQAQSFRKPSANKSLPRSLPHASARVARCMFSIIMSLPLLNKLAANKRRSNGQNVSFKKPWNSPETKGDLIPAEVLESKYLLGFSGKKQRVTP